MVYLGSLLSAHCWCHQAAPGEEVLAHYCFETPPIGYSLSLQAGAFLSRDETAKREEASGIIQFKVVHNDGKPEHMIWLVTLKNIFSQQLPNMPREYIARLVLDRNHKSLMVVKQGSCVGGITFRSVAHLFIRVFTSYLVRSFHFREQKGFAEIAFCAIKAEQQVRASSLMFGVNESSFSELSSLYLRAGYSFMSISSRIIIFIFKCR